MKGASTCMSKKTYKGCVTSKMKLNKSSEHPLILCLLLMIKCS